MKFRTFAAVFAALALSILASAAHAALIPAAQSYVDRLKKADVKFDIIRDEWESNAINVGFKGDNGNRIDVVAIFERDSEHIGFRAFSLIKAPNADPNTLLRAVNDLNREYKHVKFCYDAKDKSVDAEMDLFLLDKNERSAGERCVTAMALLIKICDNAYPKLMRAVWD